MLYHENGTIFIECDNCMDSINTKCELKSNAISKALSMGWKILKDDNEEDEHYCGKQCKEEVGK